MSNELTMMDAQLPAHLADVAGNDLSDSLVTTGPSITKLSIKGSKFVLKRGDEDIPLRTLEVSVVIVAALPLSSVPAKTFYKTKFTEGDLESPDCFSTDGIRPDAGAVAPQCDTTCAVCPKNAWGSRKTDDGRDAKACSDNKILYVLFPKQKTGEIHDEVVQVRVPATSLKSLSQYVAKIQSHFKRKVPINAIVTKISFTDAAYPQLQFEFGGFLSESQFATVSEVAGGEVIAQILRGEVAIADTPSEPESITVVEDVVPEPVEEVPVASKQSSVFDAADLGEVDEEEELEEELEEVDAEGRTWDSRIDSSNRKKSKTGRWMRRRGLADVDYLTIKNELMGKSVSPEPVVEEVIEAKPAAAEEVAPTSNESIDDELDALLADLG